MSDDSVGVAGLGAMGMGTALALVDAVLRVAGFDVDTTKLQAFEAGGGIACDSPAAMAAHTDRVVTMVVNASQVESVLFGDRGLAAAFEGGLVIQSATVAPAWIRDLDVTLAARGIEVLDAPVSGGPARARRRAVDHALRPAVAPRAGARRPRRRGCQPLRDG